MAHVLEKGIERPKCVLPKSKDSNTIYYEVVDFFICDQNGYKCPIDFGIDNISLYLTGRVKPIFYNGSDITNENVVNNLKIIEWWVSPYTDGSKIGVCTEYTDYILSEPQHNYIKYMKSVNKKIHLSTQVFHFLLNDNYNNTTYVNMLYYLENFVTNPLTNKKLTEEDLIIHATFIIDRVVDFDVNGNHYLELTETQCIKELIKLSKTLKLDISKRSERVKDEVKPDIRKWQLNKNTTTESVRAIFENVFADQLDVKINNEPKNIQDNTAFDECNKKTTKMCKNLDLRKKMFIRVYENSEELIGRIEYFCDQKKKAHINIYIKGKETILGNEADPKELFALNTCTNINVSNISTILKVTHIIPHKNWSKLRSQNILEPVNSNSDNSYYYQFQYDTDLGGFEYPKLENCSVTHNNFCNNCEIRTLEKRSQIPTIFMEKYDAKYLNEKFKFHDEMFNIGSFIYLKSDTFSTSQRKNFIHNKPFVHNITNKKKRVLKKVDQTKYPEYYRKTLGNTMRGSNENTQKPFEIGEILAIYSHERDPKMMKLIVRRMYRAEHVQSEDCNKNTDLNMLYWSSEEFIVPVLNMRGKCYVACSINIIDPIIWSAGGPDRFYFKNRYDFITGVIKNEYDLPCDAKLTGCEVRVNYDYNFVDKHKTQNIPAYKKMLPLRGLDIFAGCGGLSKGLEDSGLVKIKWAIENNEPAAAAFKANNPEATVFVENCNDVLKLAIAGKRKNSKNQRIPLKGDVEFICGGPPCQGFSGMNRFTSSESSKLKNSLIETFLSFIEYYKPKFVVMENVREFARFKNSVYFRKTLRLLISWGYQCEFGIMQAGSFGVPQTRRRLIIIAAAPGEKLPLYPEPTHVFHKKDLNLPIKIGNKIFRTNCQYGDSAPMRTVTITDAWSDLPAIKTGAKEDKIHYKSTPITHFQRLLRCPDDSFKESVLTDHICKTMSPISQARIELIPCEEGADWRDLPNKIITLSDGTKTTKLVYKYKYKEKIKKKKYKKKIVLGVCRCAGGGNCNPQNRQTKTIIPWGLSHTGYKNNNFVGVFGRLAWSGYCSTTITNPEPIGKLGRVLHPDQHRVISVREYARSQGFNDSYIFSGTILDKYRQIGNAVPPPMAAAIGREIIKAIEKKMQG